MVLILFLTPEKQLQLALRGKVLVMTTPDAEAYNEYILGITADFSEKEIHEYALKDSKNIYT